MIKIAIIGSREFRKLERIDEYLSSVARLIPCLEVVSGGARGVDKRAEDWCNRNGVKCDVIRPVNPKDKISYLFRNIEIITKADLIVAFWDRDSRGTRFVIDYAKARNKHIRIFKEI